MATLVTRPPRPAIQKALANRFGPACLNAQVGEIRLQNRSNSDSSFPRRLIISCSCLRYRVFVCSQNDALIVHDLGTISLRACFPAFGHTQSHYVLSPLTTAATCRDLTIPHGKISSNSKSKTMDTVQITCDEGFNLVNGTSATCSPVGPGKSDWTSVAGCEGRFD